MRFDITIKNAFAGMERAFAKAFLDLDIKYAEPLNIEFLKIEEKRADYIGKIKDIDDREFILHIEFQTTNYPDMHFRMLRYFTEVHRSYNLDVIQVVVYFGKTPLGMKNSINSHSVCSSVDYSYKIVDVKKIPCDRFLNSNDSDTVIFTLLCDIDTKDKRALVREVLHKIREIHSHDVDSFKNSMLKLETLSELRDLREIIKEEEKSMDLAEVKIENLPSYQIGYEYGEAKGEAKGEARAYKQAITAMSSLGIPIDVIAQKLNISQEDVKKLLANN